MRKTLWICLLAIFVTACGGRDGDQNGPAPIVVTIEPLRLIVAEIVGDRMPVVRLMDPAASPHTYEPRPSDMAAARRAVALFFVDPNLDGWAARIAANNKTSVFDLVPPSSRRTLTDSGTLFIEDEAAHEGHDHAHHDHAHDHEGADPHFWTDPLVVAALAPVLAAELGRLDPANAAHFQERAEAMAAGLRQLDEELAIALKPHRGAAVILFHPSFHYFAFRYGLEVPAVVEPSPGKEASIAYLRRIGEIARERQVRLIATEPQLARRPAEVVAEATGLPLVELDPLGALGDPRVIGDLIRFNAMVIREALE